MAKSTKSSKASDFDADTLIAEMQEQFRREKEAAQKKEALIKEYSIRWNMKDEESPLPGMKLNAWCYRWEPENIEEFIRKHGEECKKIIAELKEDKPVQSEHQCTIAPGKPTQPRVSKAAIATENQPPELDNPTIKEADVIPVSAPVIETPVAETHPQPMSDSSEPSTVEQSKKSRISAKKVDADFDELCREFIHPASLGEKKPVFLPLALRDRLDDIARLSGDRRVSASHIAINIISRWIDDNRDTLNRKISNKDFSI